MMSWVLSLFFLGLLGLLFNIFGGVWFTSIWAVVLMVFSFNMLNKVYKKEFIVYFSWLFISFLLILLFSSDKGSFKSIMLSDLTTAFPFLIFLIFLIHFVKVWVNKIFHLD